MTEQATSANAERIFERFAIDRVPVEEHAKGERFGVRFQRLGEFGGAAHVELAAGHYVCFPAGQKAGHTLVNHTTAPCRYLVIGERNSHDVIVFTDSGRVSVRLTGEGYRKSATMDYWEAERGAESGMPTPS